MPASDTRSGAGPTMVDAPARGGFWTRAGLAISLAVVGNVLVWWLATTLLAIPESFLPLAGPVPAIFFTVIGMVGAVIAWRIVLAISSTPHRTYRRVALVVLVLSFIPDLWLLSDGASAAAPGATVAGVLTLMIMHVVAAAAAVYILAGNRGGEV